MHSTTSGNLAQMKCQRAYGLNVRFWHAADRVGGHQVCYEQGIVIRTLRITLLSDSGYALTGYEY